MLQPVAVVERLCIQAAQEAGAAEAAAAALADAIIHAELRGRSSVGVSHLFDYLAGLESGAINGAAVPLISVRGGIIACDAGKGIPHTGFLEAVDTILDVAGTHGCAVFLQNNSYTCGELGYFTDRLAEAGLVSLAAANSPALMAVGSSGRRVLGTNPISFAAPTGAQQPFLIDQASTETAFVAVREAAAAGRAIPAGWAVDSQGEPTTDSRAAVEGSLLPYGGHKGANMALVAEVLAGLAGGLWSVDAPSFTEGSASPEIGMTVLAINPRFADAAFPLRLGAHLDRLSRDYQVRIPGRRPEGTAGKGELEIDSGLFEKLQSAAQKNTNRKSGQA
ncbi:Ldh family oxidoreductase [Pseudarthrobacter psychrotolerans]|uniref:Ldh family oxidoreductase n=1 Tax=Pseudarthrobacter psychrotolerans TaxID=2697569 RepID=A0A6P1NKA7_9MICC|nr:Ldh family oxidoreductase [Pseudarthrobacter psychrotolerans]QHK18924.1 Ldh family oxidoreductase [Pseudarthrobacter psychrotolerans]